MDEHSQITPIGITNYRNTNIRFGIKDDDRLQHIYVIGKTGTGKSTLLQNMTVSDIRRGNGIGVIDPHGDIARNLLKFIPAGRGNDLIYFDATDKQRPIGFNPLSEVPPEQHHLVASGLVSTFKKIWSESWGPRLEHILRFSLLTLLTCPDSTLLDIQPLLTNSTFRSEVLSYASDEQILSFWHNEFNKYAPQFRSEAIAPILNKIGLFASSKPLRNIVGQRKSSFKVTEILDEKKIFIANISKGEIGEEASSLLGSMLVSSIGLSALQRANRPEEKRVPFYLYVDEMHSFITLEFTGILSEARKYKLSLFLVHQYISQLIEEVRSAIFGNIGTMISFRIGAEDAEYLAKEFFPIFNEEDLVNLPRYKMYLKLMINGTTSKPFSAQSIKTN